MLSRSSVAAYSSRQLSQSSRTLVVSQLRTNTTSAPSVDVEAQKKRRLTPLAQDFAGLIIPDIHAQRAARDASRGLVPPGSSTIASRLAGRGSDGASQSSQTQPHGSQTYHRTSGQSARRPERSGGKRVDATQSNRWAQRSTAPSRSNKVQEDELDLTLALKPEAFAINIGTDLVTLFSHPSTTPKAEAAVPAIPAATSSPSQEKPLGLPTVSLQYTLRRQGGDYSRIGPRPIRYIEGDSIRTLGAQGLAEQIIRRKAEVGLKSKANALQVVSRLTSKVSQNIRA